MSKSLLGGRVENQILRISLVTQKRYSICLVYHELQERDDSVAADCVVNPFYGDFRCAVPSALVYGKHNQCQSKIYLSLPARLIVLLTVLSRNGLGSIFAASTCKAIGLEVQNKADNHKR